MARAVAAAMWVAAFLAFSSTARGQPVSCGCFGVSDADSASDDEEADVATPKPQLLPHCCATPVPVTPPWEASDGELRGVMAGGATAAVVSYLFATLYASTRPHFQPATEGIPVVGAIVSAARSTVDARATPLLLFSAGVQVVGIIVAAGVGAELAQRRRYYQLDFSACSTGAAAGVTWHY